MQVTDRGAAPPSADVLHGRQYAVQRADAHAGLSTGSTSRTCASRWRRHGAAERGRGPLEAAHRLSLTQGWGLTEASPVGCCINSGPDTEFNGSIGLPLPSTEITIRDDEGRDLELGAVGEICLRGPQVMRGYWQRPDETAKVMLPDGWLRTGDIGRIDARGFVFIEDRKKDMIIVSGLQGIPERGRGRGGRQHPGVLEVAAVAQPDEHSGEVVALFMVRKDPALTEKEVIDYCRKSLVAYKVPRHVFFRNELPKSNVGKILRKTLREELAHH